MNHGPTFEDMAVVRFNKLVDLGFNQAAVGLWMDLMHPALVDASPHGPRPSPATLAKWDQATSQYSSAARRISAQLLAAATDTSPDDEKQLAAQISQDLFREIAAACADDLAKP